MPRNLHQRDGPYVVSGASLAAAGVYLFLRVMFACDGCLESGYGAPDDFLHFFDGFSKIFFSPPLRRLLSQNNHSTFFLCVVAVSQDIVQQQHLAIAAALLAAGLLDMLYGAAIYNKRRYGDSTTHNCLSRFQVFEADWVHEGWFGSIAAIGLMFIAHPQADTHNALIHVTIGVALVLGAHAIVCERRNSFLPKLVLTNAALDGEATVAVPATMDAIATAPRGVVPAGVCFMSAAVGLAAFRESELEHVGVEVACSPAGYALVVGTECWSVLLAVSAAMAAALKLDARAASDGGNNDDASALG